MGEKKHAEDKHIEVMVEEPAKAVQGILKYFAYEHLRVELQEVGRPCAELALAMVARLNNTHNPSEAYKGLCRLLEAKDCFVRAALSE